MDVLAGDVIVTARENFLISQLLYKPETPLPPPPFFFFKFGCLKCLRLELNLEPLVRKLTMFSTLAHNNVTMIKKTLISIIKLCYPDKDRH